ncbi:MAG: cell division protein ZapA [Arenicella sp.]
MKATRESVKIQVMGKEFAVACEPEEKVSLLAASRYLDEQIDLIQSQGKIVGNERIAIMVAINLASELLELRKKQSSSDQMSDEINLLSEKIDQVMNGA